MTELPPDKIKPENNPWYLLATLHGEAASADDEVHARNRTAWNRFMASELTEEARALLINERGFSDKGLTPFSVEELADVERRFGERYRRATGGAGTPVAAPALPDLKQQRINFSNVKFDRLFLVRGFLFPHWTNFSGAIFCSPADFLGTTFFGSANFLHARFCDQSYFSYTLFCDQSYFSYVSFTSLANFSDARFSSEAHFSNVRFSRCWAYFLRARFCDKANFWNTKFSRLTNFSGVTFEKESLFVNAKMEGPTSFRNAKFISEPPQFFEAKLHQGTVWRDVEWPPPPKDHIDAGLFVDAYACLKLEMDRLKKHEDELDFFARELQSRRVLQGDWQPVSELNVCGRAISVPPLEVSEKAITPKPRTLFGRTFTLPSFTIKARTIQLLRPAPGLAIALYGWLSDYGRSYVRPLYGLLITAAAGVLPLWWHLCGLWRAIGHSLANTFGVFGFRRDLIGSDVLAALPGLLKVLAAAQTIAGIVLLFLLGVAIRNRFRMK